MRRAALTVLALVLVLALAANAIQFRNSAAQAPVTLGVDAQVDGNTATSIASIESCTSAEVGDTFNVDLYVTNVQELVAFELYFAFDGAIIEVADHDLRQFLTSSPRNSLITEKGVIPNSTGRHFLGAADTKSPETGSGVLVRLTLTAKAAGRSPATLLLFHIWPNLTNADSQHIGDVDGDNLFDGPISQAEIAVGEPCIQPPPQPSPTATPGSTPPPETTPSPFEDDDLPPSLPGLSDSPGPLPSEDEDAPPPDAIVLSIGEDLPPPLSGLSDSPTAVSGEDQPETDAAAGETNTTSAGEGGADPTDEASSPAGEGGSSGGFPLWLIAALGLFAIVAGAAVLLLVRSGRGANWRG